jgi:hypothetical protein
MNWQTEEPKQTGWYWVRVKGWPQSLITWYEVGVGAIAMYASQITNWMGPLDEPKKPE